MYISIRPSQRSARGDVRRQVGNRITGGGDNYTITGNARITDNRITGGGDNYTISGNARIADQQDNRRRR